MSTNIETTADLIFEVRQLDVDGAQLGAANWILALIDEDDDDDSFDSAGDFVELWLETSHVPDEQMGWILSNGFGSDWSAPLVERLGEATQANDTPQTARVLDLLGLAGQYAGQPPVYLGASGDSTPPPPPMIDLAPPKMATPPTPAPTPAPAPAHRAESSQLTADDLDPRRFQISRDLDASRVVQFEFSAREGLENLPVAGDVELLADLIPERGLPTRWVVSSTQPLTAIDPEVTVYPFLGADSERWVAEFGLVIPKLGNSEVRRLHCDGDGQQVLDVRIYAAEWGVGADLLRQLMVSVGPADDSELDVDDDAVGDIRDSIDPPHHEFTTPPDELMLTVADGSVFFKHANSPPGTIYWPSAAELSGPIATLRKKADDFRSTHSAQLDDIDADELATRLARDLASHYLGRTRDWGFEPYDDVEVSQHHQAQWDAVADSNEAKDLAFYGYALYNTIFPEDTQIRMLLDTMPTGSRVNVDWPVEAGNASVPWNLMYTALPATGPIDAECFLGLRFRFSWSKWRRAPASQVLGKVATAERLHVLYWDDDDIGDEAAHQRTQAGEYSTHRVVPDTLGPDMAAARQQAIQELTTPTAAAVLHFYCHCVHDAAAKETKLIFGQIQHQAEFMLSGRDFGAGRFVGEPLVFVNACDSAGSGAYEVNQLEQMFFSRGCRAFMGTEVKVPIALAARFAHVFFGMLEAPLDDGRLFTGEAAAQARRYLWLNYRNVGGLFYSYIHHYGLRMEP